MVLFRRAVIVTEHVLIKVPMQMERLDSNAYVPLTFVKYIITLKPLDSACYPRYARRICNKDASLAAFLSYLKSILCGTYKL